MENKLENTKPASWLKPKGYLHLTRNINIGKNYNEINAKLKDKYFIAKYAFYPLIHTAIKERKYKKIDIQKHCIINSKIRSHKHKDKLTGEVKRTIKSRPLHYSTHFDAIIYGYYAHLLQTKYEERILAIPDLSECITAYRKIKINPELEDDIKGNGKSTIHFAKDIFSEISKRAKHEDVSVLAFDIKSFFSSLDHQKLREIWEDIMGFENGMDDFPDHKNVFKATTKFNYVLLDDLRLRNVRGKKAGYDEKKLAHIRKTKGFKSFFESNKDFREAIKSKQLRIFANPFKKKGSGEIMGIPQGLPISAVLANMYLFNFDKSVLNELVINQDCYYRRYSDDIIIICNSAKVDLVEKFIIRSMNFSKVQISKDKTEKFDFRFLEYNKRGDKRLTSLKYKNLEEKKEAPLVYLGFEYRGYNILVKSANIAKFYRRIITIVKRRANRAKKVLKTNPYSKKAIFLNQIKKLYKLKPKSKNLSKIDKPQKNKKFLVQNDKGEFFFKEIPPNKNKKNKSNYFSYLKRAGRIMENTVTIRNQLRKTKHILWTSINKNFNEKQ